LKNPPGTADKDDVALIRTRCSRVVGVLNQYNVVARGEGTEKANELIATWTEVLVPVGIERTVTFDAHWDSPSKIQQVYEAIADLLPEERATEFHTSLLELRELLATANQEGFGLIADLVLEAQLIHEKEDSEKFSYDSGKARNAVTGRVRAAIEHLVKAFAEEIATRYTIATEPITLSACQQMMYLKEDRDSREPPLEEESVPL
jgi:hypothetical protein